LVLKNERSTGVAVYKLRRGNVDALP